MLQRVVADFSDWRRTARALLRDGVPPDQVSWSSHGDRQVPLFAAEAEPESSSSSAGAILIPRAFLALAEPVSRHSDTARWHLLYRVAWRLTHGEHRLLEVSVDHDIMAVEAMRRAVEKDIYRMRAFVRFRRVNAADGERFVAWYQPAHRTLDANGKFFVDRFGSMRWAILTPELSLLWDLEKLTTGPGVPRSQAPQDDELEELWRLYYATVFNPARLKLNAMRAQLPLHRWIDLPESRAIPELVRQSRGRVQEMAAAQPSSASAYIPAGAGLETLREAVHRCAACPLCSRATQPVWGEGNPRAGIMLVGEQPGNDEDLAGRPFVGPAGQVLDDALREAGLVRADLYVTNAVKAFKFEERGKRRIHQTPRASEIAACHPWLLAEIDSVAPRLIVCLGASAAQSVLGRTVRIAADRVRLHDRGPARVLVTYHPSAILRTPDEAARRQLYSTLVEDLARARGAAAEEILAVRPA